METFSFFARYRSRRSTAGRVLGLFCGVLLLLHAMVAVSAGAEVGEKEVQLTELPLEKLLDISVVSASRKTQSLGEVSSAVFVITQEDIRHSGATTIPDLLRMVPGVQVAAIDGVSWAVSIRGFNGTFANKLLVMIDGRTVYTPLFGGVFWDVQDTLLHDIERIEVIRGPGSTMWGANAVNGVINIITKKSGDTQGGVLTGLTGNRERGTVGLRYGSWINDTTSYRVFVKHLDRDDTKATANPVPDSLQITRGGFRIDSEPRDSLKVTLQGDLYSGRDDYSFALASFSPPYRQVTPAPTDLYGGNILSRIDWLQSESSKFSLQLYYDRTSRKAMLEEDRDTVDIDLQHNHRIDSTNEVTMGVGYRFLRDETRSSKGFFTLTPPSSSEQLMTLFAQDEITLLPETLLFTIGTKLEHNDHSGWEVQPSARLSWKPREGYRLWAAVTRSVRTLSRGELDSRINFAVVPTAPLLSVVSLMGNRKAESESLVAYELGLRADLSENLSLDVTSYHNRYRDLISYRPGTPYVEGGTQVIYPFYFVNGHDFESYGGEVSLQWQPRDWWKLKGGYAYIRFFGDGVQDSMLVKATPSHQATLRSMMALGHTVDIDLWARYVGDNRYPLFVETVRIPAYVTLDVRLAWRPLAGVELSLVGQNLLEPNHLETVSDMTDAIHEVQRTVYGKVTWEF